MLIDSLCDGILMVLTRKARQIQKLTINLGFGFRRRRDPQFKTVCHFSIDRQGAVLLVDHEKADWSLIVFVGISGNSRGNETGYAIKRTKRCLAQ